MMCIFGAEAPSQLPSTGSPAAAAPPRAAFFFPVSFSLFTLFGRCFFPRALRVFLHLFLFFMLLCVFFGRTGEGEGRENFDFGQFLDVQFF